MGRLQIHSAHFNHSFDVNWLAARYQQAGAHGTPVLLVHGHCGAAAADLKKEVAQHPGFSAVRAPHIPDEGAHNARLMLLWFERGLRVVISTANLEAKSWNGCCTSQGSWVSPIFPLRDSAVSQVAAPWALDDHGATQSVASIV